MICNQVEMRIKDATQEEKPVIRMDSTRQTVGRTRYQLSPYASTAKQTAQHYAAEAKYRFGPGAQALGPKIGMSAAQARRRAKASASHAAHTAGRTSQRHLVPQLGHAFTTLPAEAQERAVKAAHLAQEAALTAKVSALKAAKAAEQARTTVVPRVSGAVENARAAVTPMAHEAQARGAAAVTALQGHVSAAEISHLASRNLKRQRRAGWARGLAVMGTVAIGTGVLAWQWWRHQSNPEWLVEPPSSQTDSQGTAGGPLNGSSPMDSPE